MVPASIAARERFVSNTATRRADPALDKALALLDAAPLVDGHNDLPWVIREAARGDVVGYDLNRAHQETDTDIPRLREGKVAAQFWAAFLPTAIPHPGRAVLEQIDLIRRMNEAYPETFLPAFKASDVMRAKKAGKIASFITVEGGVGLENSLAPLRIWHAAGARLMTLCHNESLDWVDSATDRARHGGLTAFGRAVIAELNRLGMIVDLAHVSADVMRQVLDISTAPVVFSHSNARALCDHPRNVPDDVLARVKDNGGIVMATFVPKFIRPAGAQSPAAPASLEDLAGHIEYLADKAGLAHVGIGSDFFGGPTPAGLEHVGRFPHLVAEMIRRGWSDEAVVGLAGGNFLRVFRAVEREGRRQRTLRGPGLGTVESLDRAG